MGAVCSSFMKPLFSCARFLRNMTSKAEKAPEKKVKTSKMSKRCPKKPRATRRSLSRFSLNTLNAINCPDHELVTLKSRPWHKPPMHCEDDYTICQDGELINLNRFPRYRCSPQCNDQPYKVCPSEECPSEECPSEECPTSEYMSGYMDSWCPCPATRSAWPVDKPIRCDNPRTCGYPIVQNGFIQSVKPLEDEYSVIAKEIPSSNTQTMWQPNTSLTNISQKIMSHISKHFPQFDINQIDIYPLMMEVVQHVIMNNDIKKKNQIVKKLITYRLYIVFS